MLQCPSSPASECLEHARRCEQRAENARREDDRAWYLAQAERWRQIAATYEYIDRVRRFLDRKV